MEKTEQGCQLDPQFYKRILDALATSVCVEQLADASAEAVSIAIGGWCALWLKDHSSSKQKLVGVQHSDRNKRDIVWRLAIDWPDHGQISLDRTANSNTPRLFVLAGYDQYQALFGSETLSSLAREAGTGSLAIVPLIHDERQIGLFAAASPSPDFFGPKDYISIANELAKHISTVIARFQQAKLIRSTSQQLTLTSLRLQAILESIPQGIIVIDSRNNRIVFANSSFFRMLGLPEVTQNGKLLELTLPAITYPNGGSRTVEEAPWIRGLRTGLSTSPEEMVIHLPNGQESTILCNASPIHDERGSIIGTVALLQDISERKQFEQQKDEFLAMVAHELRTPLTALKGYIQILLRRIAREPNKQLTEKEVGMLQTVDRQVSRFSRLIFQLLDFSRIQAGRLELNLTHFSLEELIRTVVSQQQVAAPDRSISFEAADENIVYADQDRIEQVLNNLIFNAIKATKTGGQITICVKRGAKSVMVSVADDGAGIAEEAKKHLFDRLYRGPSNSHEGMGLGLFISKGVIDAHGGEIWFESELEKGSVFHFTIPIIKED